MKILALDTSTKFLCLAILRQDGEIFKFNRDLDKRHSELLIPTIEKLIKLSKVPLEGIDYLAIGKGPGSFTGLRIGLSTIKGFAFALGVPIVSISSLDVIAKNINVDGYVCVIVDARRNLIYNCLYRIKGGSIKRVSPYRLSGVRDLIRLVKPFRKVIFTADAINLYRQDIQKALKRNAEFADESLWYPKPLGLLNSAKEKIKNKEFTKPEKLLPLYLYPKECQIRKE